MAEDAAVLDNPLLAEPEQPLPTEQQQMVQDFPLLQPPSEVAPETAVAPQAPVQPQAEVSPRDQYVAMQLRLADLIRQRGEREVGVPPGERQPNEEEQALKQQLESVAPPQQARQPIPFQRPLTYTQTAEANLQAAEEQKNRAVRNALSQIRVTNIAEANKALAYYKQEQAGNRWRTIYGSQVAAGIDPTTASANAWREVAPLVFQSSPASLGAAVRAATPPPQPARFSPANPATGEPAHWKTGPQGTTVQQVHAPPKTVYDEPQHVGSQIVKYNRDGTVQVLFDANAEKLTAMDRLRWQDASNEIKAANIDLRQQRQIEAGEETPQNRIKKAKAVQDEIARKHIENPTEITAQPALKAQTLQTAPAAPPPVNTPSGIPPTIMTKKEFDALDSGTIYIGKDGRKYRKP